VQLRRLGATVVAADFGSLTICTGKHNLSAAVSYTDYLINAVRRKELFKWIALSPIRHW
jgi:DNA polymerase epsilon subunit 1